MSVRRELLDMIDREDVFDAPPADLNALRLEAARELFAERREQIAVLGRRADETGVREVRSFADLVPLLFAHTVYKSYPAALVEKGRWGRLLQWLQTLSVQDVSNTDLDGVVDVDDWITRLRAAGHLLLATSGSSGKVSFLNQTVGDRDGKKRHFTRTMGWPFARPNADRAFFALGPSQGFNSAIEAQQIQAEIWGRPDARFFLTDEPLLIREVSAMAALRKRMADGDAAPSEIRQAEEAGAAKAARMNAALDRIADTILAHRHEPIVLGALWAQHMMIIDKARALGVEDGAFHPDSLIMAGGGVKGVTLPPDYKARVDAFYGDVIRPGGYGMTEMAQRLPRCEAGRYHVPPGLIPLLLDRPGEALQNPDGSYEGVIEGRFAFLDLLYEGRWGGLISGDKVEMDFASHCACGRPGPTLLDTITRYSQPGEDDHIGCAGTIDAYVRGEMAA
jgi:hypothetical protein